MRKHFQKTLSALFAIALLGSAVMLSVSSAEGPYRHAGQNAFNGPPLGHPDKALIQVRWLEECESAAVPSDKTAFDWQLDACDACPKCGFKDSQVAPVVLDVPDFLGPSDATAIEVIKRKLGINPFRGSIFEEPSFSAVQIFGADAPPRLATSICEPICEAGACSSATCGTCCDASDTCRTAAATATAAKIRNEVVSSHETCAAGSECSAAGAQCDPGCNGSDACTCAAEPRTNIGVASDWLTFNPRSQAFASSIEEDPVAALRRASLDLDEAAMKLEVSDRYAEADALREAAQQLRFRARQLKQGAEVTSSSSASAVQATGYSPATHCSEDFISPVTSDQTAAPYYFQFVR
jgi:hypothetical protein